MPETQDSTRLNDLSAALIAPDAVRRRAITLALAGSQLTVDREFSAWPSQDDLLEIARLKYPVAMVDLDSDTDRALRVIEDLCSRDITVMAFSGRNDATLLRRSMQAGAREFLIEPVLPETVREAFLRAAARRRPRPGKASGKMLVFVPSKGGVGVTTIATNFALALTKESGARVVVVDLDFERGEVALGLGMTATFSIADALQNPERLDREFVSTLLLRHSSGLAVLAAPEEYKAVRSTVEAAEKLFRILCAEFDYVVVDAATCPADLQKVLFEAAATIYLVTESTFPALRNARRLIAFLSAKDRSRELKIVLNRFNSRHGGVDETSATKAMARPVNWRIPNGYEAARAAEDAGVPLAMEDSPITRALVQMARAACGKPQDAEKQTRKRFSLFGSKLLSPQVES
jgi:pilus assembly protein CpaE